MDSKSLFLKRLDCMVSWRILRKARIIKNAGRSDRGLGGLEDKLRRN